MFYVAKNGKRWEIRLFAGFRWLKTHPYCKTLEQDWSKLDGDLLYGCPDTVGLRIGNPTCTNATY
jgi:hypothetical protein